MGNPMAVLNESLFRCLSALRSLPEDADVALKHRLFPVVLRELAIVRRA